MSELSINQFVEKLRVLETQLSTHIYDELNKFSKETGTVPDVYVNVEKHNCWNIGDAVSSHKLSRVRVELKVQL